MYVCNLHNLQFWGFFKVIQKCKNLQGNLSAKSSQMFTKFLPISYSWPTHTNSIANFLVNTPKSAFNLGFKHIILFAIHFHRFMSFSWNYIITVIRTTCLTALGTNPATLSSLTTPRVWTRALWATHADR